jgi:hypothetical protein
VIFLIRIGDLLDEKGGGQGMGNFIFWIGDFGFDVSLAQRGRLRRVSLYHFLLN